MSDFSALEQSFALPSAVLPPIVDAPLSTDIQPYEVGFRRLRGPREIGRVRHLRNQIRLPASAVNDSEFTAREKKETRWVWWEPLSVTVSTSVPSATCR